MASTATQAPEESGNSIGRIWGVLFSPKATFAAIAQKPTWLAPVLLSLVVSIALVTVFTNRVGWQRFTERQIALNPSAQARMDQLSPEQRATQIAIVTKITEFATIGIAVTGPFLFTLIFAAIFLGLFKLGYGAQVNLKTSMGVVAYAFVPRILYALVGILVIFLKDPSQVDLQNLLASNPGALLSPETTARWLVVLATQIDFFTFWVMILLAMGYHAANPKKVSTAGAFAGIAGLWLIWVIVIVGFTAAVS
ncbi:MAG TPA: Yip1 family protein [Candidatus Acidoferrales bacterium]|nr:Yip1 family protein [Candidatus Acidoferrales bacterium]